MVKRKKILFVDVPETCYWFARFITRAGYEPIALYNSNIGTLSEIVLREQIDLIVVAKELTLKGPSLSDDWKKSDSIEVDREFGHNVLSRFHREKINLPAILLTTDDLREKKMDARQ